MPRKFIILAATAIVVACAGLWSSVFAGDNVGLAMETLDKSISDPSVFSPLASTEEKFLKLESSARQSEARELFRRVRIEQVYRAALDYDKRKALLHDGASAQDEEELKSRIWAKITEIDAENRVWLKSTLARIGWFRISVYGPHASHMAWVLVQHADRDSAWQKEMLGTLQSMVVRGEVSGSDVAYLGDRIAASEAKPQTYGTQGMCQGGSWKPFVIADAEHVDVRRKAIGLEPIDEYAKQFKDMCKGS